MRQNVLELAKGVHPGLLLDRELKKRAIPKSRFAISIGEYPQTLVAITKGKRKMNTSLAMRIENELNIEEGFFMTLQVFYEIAVERKRTQQKPDTGKFSKSLFWDTTLDAIDWQKHKRSVIERVFERGDEEEKKEIERFYGAATVRSILSKRGH